MINIWTIVKRQSILDIFWTTFSVSIGLRIGQDLRNVRILHLYSEEGIVCAALALGMLQIGTGIEQ